jgi:hypothetical protein
VGGDISIEAKNLHEAVSGSLEQEAGDIVQRAFGQLTVETTFVSVTTQSYMVAARVTLFQ